MLSVENRAAVEDGQSAEAAPTLEVVQKTARALLCTGSSSSAPGYLGR